MPSRAERNYTRMICCLYTSTISATSMRSRCGCCAPAAAAPSHRSPTSAAATTEAHRSAHRSSSTCRLRCPLRCWYAVTKRAAPSGERPSSRATVESSASKSAAGAGRASGWIARQPRNGEEGGARPRLRTAAVIHHVCAKDDVLRREFQQAAAYGPPSERQNGSCARLRCRRRRSARGVNVTSQRRASSLSVARACPQAAFSAAAARRACSTRGWSAASVSVTVAPRRAHVRPASPVPAKCGACAARAARAVFASENGGGVEGNVRARPQLEHVRTCNLVPPRPSPARKHRSAGPAVCSVCSRVEGLQRRHSAAGRHLMQARHPVAVIAPRRLRLRRRGHA